MRPETVSTFKIIFGALNNALEFIEYHRRLYYCHAFASIDSMLFKPAIVAKVRYTKVI